jgi:HlyD family secretion protein
VKKKIITGTIIIVLLSVAAYYLFFIRESDTSTASSLTNFIVKREMPLRRGDLRLTVSATGVITPINVIEVKSKASGIVETIPIETSDPIRVGQLIARLDQTDTRNSFEQAFADSQVAAATLVQQENNWKRALDFYQKQLISQQELDQFNVDYVKSKAALVKAQSALLLARQKLAETIVLSPVNGLVLSRNVSAGQIIASAVSNVGGGTVIARVANMDEVYVIASVDEVDIGRITIGQEAKIVADAYPDDVFYGKVLRVAAQSTVIQNVTTFDVVILVPNKSNKLKSGMNGNITIDIYHRDNVLLISNELVRDFSEVQTDMKILKEAGIEMKDHFSDSAKARVSDASGINTKNDFRPKQQFRKKEKSSSADESSIVKKKRKFVVVKENDRLILKRIETGVSNYDESEVISGLTDSSKVMLVKFSQARQESEQRREMLKNRMGGAVGTSRRN